jgi:hypothetical protein
MLPAALNDAYRKPEIELFSMITQTSPIVNYSQTVYLRIRRFPSMRKAVILVIFFSVSGASFGIESGILDAMMAEMGNYPPVYAEKRTSDLYVFSVEADIGIMLFKRYGLRKHGNLVDLVAYDYASLDKEAIAEIQQQFLEILHTLGDPVIETRDGKTLGWRSGNFMIYMYKMNDVPDRGYHVVIQIEYAYR